MCISPWSGGLLVVIRSGLKPHSTAEMHCLVTGLFRIMYPPTQLPTELALKMEIIDDCCQSTPRAITYRAQPLD